MELDPRYEGRYVVEGHYSVILLKFKYNQVLLDRRRLFSELEKSREELLVARAMGFERTGLEKRRGDKLWDALMDSIEWADDCMGYAMEGWAWKYGRYWKEAQGKAKAALERWKR